MQSPDHMIARVNAWLAATGTPIVAAARAARVAENTAHAVLRGGQGRIETLRRLCGLVPVDFQTSPSVGLDPAGEAEQVTQESAVVAEVPQAPKNANLPERQHTCGAIAQGEAA